MASFPSSLKTTFGPRRQDLVNVVEADDVNEVYDEVVAIEATLGRNVHISTLFPTAASVADRLGFADDLLSTLKGWFNNDGTVTQAQVTGLAATLAGITVPLAGKADTSYVDSHDGATLTSAQAYTDSQLSVETAARTSADTGLQNQINTEVTNRGNADTAETSARIAGDNALQTQVNNRSVIGHQHTPADSGIHFGSFTVSLDVNGNGSIPHGMGAAPTMAVVTHWTGGHSSADGNGGPILVTVKWIDATYIHIHAWTSVPMSSTTGQSEVSYTSTNANFMWIAIA